MGFFKSAGNSFLKYGEKIVNKTEGYTKIAKLKIDIKRLEDEIEKYHIKAGRLTTSEYQKGNMSFDLSSNEMKDIVNKIESNNKLIADKKREVEELKVKENLSEDDFKDN